MLTDFWRKNKISLSA